MKRSHSPSTQEMGPPLKSMKESIGKGELELCSSPQLMIEDEIEKTEFSIPKPIHKSESETITSQSGTNAISHQTPEKVVIECDPTCTGVTTNDRQIPIQNPYQQQPQWRKPGRPRTLPTLRPKPTAQLLKQPPPYPPQHRPLVSLENIVRGINIQNSGGIPVPREININTPHLYRAVTSISTSIYREDALPDAQQNALNWRAHMDVTQARHRLNLYTKRDQAIAAARRTAVQFLRQANPYIGMPTIIKMDALLKELVTTILGVTTEIQSSFQQQSVFWEC